MPGSTRSGPLASVLRIEADAQRDHLRQRRCRCMRVADAGLRRPRSPARRVDLGAHRQAPCPGARRPASWPTPTCRTAWRERAARDRRSASARASSRGSLGQRRAPRQRRGRDARPARLRVASPRRAPRPQAQARRRRTRPRRRRSRGRPSSRAPDHREHPPGVRAFAPVRPEPVVVGRRAESRDMDVGRIERRRPRADRGSIATCRARASREAIRPGANQRSRSRLDEAGGVERLADLRPDLVAARADRRADGGDDLARRAAGGRGQVRGRRAGNPLRRAAPAGVDGARPRRPGCASRIGTQSAAFTATAMSVRVVIAASADGSGSPARQRRGVHLEGAAAVHLVEPPQRRGRHAEPRRDRGPGRRPRLAPRPGSRSRAVKP